MSSSTFGKILSTTENILRRVEGGVPLSKRDRDVLRQFKEGISKRATIDPQRKRVMERVEQTLVHDTIPNEHDSIQKEEVENIYYQRGADAVPLGWKGTRVLCIIPPHNASAPYYDLRAVFDEKGALTGIYRAIDGNVKNNNCPNLFDPETNTMKQSSDLDFDIIKPRINRTEFIQRNAAALRSASENNETTGANEMRGHTYTVSAPFQLFPHAAHPDPVLIEKGATITVKLIRGIYESDRPKMAVDDTLSIIITQSHSPSIEVRISPVEATNWYFPVEE